MTSNSHRLSADLLFALGIIRHQRVLHQRTIIKLADIASSDAGGSGKGGDKDADSDGEGGSGGNGV